jgi:hypothetical protein
VYSTWAASITVTQRKSKGYIRFKWFYSAQKKKKKKKRFYWKGSIASRLIEPKLPIRFNVCLRCTSITVDHHWPTQFHAFLSLTFSGDKQLRHPHISQAQKTRWQREQQTWWNKSYEFLSFFFLFFFYLIFFFKYIKSVIWFKLFNLFY